MVNEVLLSDAGVVSEGKGDVVNEVLLSEAGPRQADQGVVVGWNLLVSVVVTEEVVVVELVSGAAGTS